MTTALQESVLMTELRAVGGFTFNPHTSRLVDYGSATGYMIAVPGTERILGFGGMSSAEFDQAFYSAVRDAELSDYTFVGGWYSSDRNVYMIELSELHDVTRRQAVRLGIERGQEAIFDMRGEVINLKVSV
jgi:hypothetical protein